MDENDRKFFNIGFAIGFITSIFLCFAYWGLMTVETEGNTTGAQAPEVPVEVYRYTVPKISDTELDSSTSQILKYGIPDRGPRALRYINHVVGYDQARKIPLWVAEHITKDHIVGDGDRDKCSFKPDSENVDGMFSSSLDDYSKSGFDRGHMSPAANHKYSQEAMCDSFYLTNVLPQDSQQNQQYWREVETYCRDLAEKYEEVRVITGPVILPETPAGAEQGKRFVQYEVIGENNVTVPSHLFKVIVVENATETSNTTVFSTAFLVPNKPISTGEPLIKFKVPLAKLEAAVGVRFLPYLDGAPVGDFCSIDPCRLSSETAGITFTTKGTVLSGVLSSLVVFIWVFAMYKWKQQMENADKELN